MLAAALDRQIANQEIQRVRAGDGWLSKQMGHTNFARTTARYYMDPLAGAIRVTMVIEAYVRDALGQELGSGQTEGSSQLSPFID